MAILAEIKANVILQQKIKTWFLRAFGTWVPKSSISLLYLINITQRTRGSLSGKREAPL